MNTQKVAITIPSDIVAMIDILSKKHGLSRSKFISTALQEKIQEERKLEIKTAYNLVFSDPQICEEQLESTKFFEGTGNNEGQEW